MRQLLILLTFVIPALCYKTFIDTLSEDSRFSTLIRHLQTERLVPVVNKLTAGTFFAPDNEAFEKYKENVTKEVLLYHIISNPMFGEDFDQGQILESLYVRQGMLGDTHNGQRIKVTKEGSPRKGKGKVYIGGAHIIDKDIVANNQSVIQVISRLLTPPAPLVEIIKQWEQSDLFTTLEAAELLSTLNQAQPFTLFAPPEKALQPFNEIEKSYLLHEYGRKDLQLLLKYHIISGDWYAADFHNGDNQVETLSGNNLTVRVEENNSKMEIDGTTVKEVNELAANGVVHTIEHPIIPRNLLFTARKYLIGMNATKFVAMMDENGLGNYLDDTSQSLTFLAPINEAFEQFDIEAGNVTKKLLYHILPTPWQPDQLSDGLLVDTTLHDKMLGGPAQKMKVSVENDGGNLPSDYWLKPKPGKTITFDDAIVNGEPAELNGTLIYSISDVLSPPEGILSTLITDLELSTFIASLYAAKAEQRLVQSKGITLFVPSNDAFTHLGLAAKYLLHPDAKSKLASVIFHHVIPSLMYSSDFPTEDSIVVKTLAGTELQINRTSSNDITVGEPDNIISSMDVLLANGVAHKVSSIAIPDTVEITNGDLLKAIDASVFSKLLKVANLTQLLPSGNYTILAPSDKAFARLNVTQLLLDPTQLTRIVETHILKSSDIGPLKPMINENVEYETLLSDHDKVLFKEVADGQYIVEVKGGKIGNTGRVVAVGKATTGGGVVEIDSVLIPVPLGWAGLSLLAQVAIIVSSILGALAVAVIGYFVWKYLHRRRLGYVELSN
ncbi:hypothetical protein INT43_007869 [Umbelopsis isabellina]|uniref:FAS1 domain-containing protein n=1 Tax=Mortierella isabellina TaxID=91625 RepID=A0A8H7PNC2_MORIS|nr:hypothetical protein INT43_007869 [Umbelopsis isabellina]